ncbi:hypothetical protein BSKO_13115 [Bryopsis sp. KO-2023]|nr:hypothetical protein BSKO_13115 [Bryopsis sp. KO-2023]
MCRLLAYMGDPILLAHVVLWPDRSIIKQSYDARERLLDPSLPFHLAHGNLNADGFGIGWYAMDREPSPNPCVFTSITPAWNNDNLARISTKIISPLIFAHVRAAYPEMPVSEQNCHPFQWGRYMWMHNGVIGGFSKIRRKLLAELSDEAYDSVQSFHSDSAVSFAIFLNNLPDMHSQRSPEVLLQALEKTIAVIGRVQSESGVTACSLLNFVVSDGASMVATRFVSPDTATPASLYYAEGNHFHREKPEGDGNEGEDREASSILSEGKYDIAYAERGTCVAMVASEPITGSASDWVQVPKNTALVISREKSGFVNIMRAPLASSGIHVQQKEVLRCLEGISRSIGVTARPWSLKGRSHRSTYGNCAALVTQKEEHRLTGHGASVLCMILDEDRKRLFSGSMDGLIKVWDLDELQLIYTLEGHRKPVIKLHLEGKRLFSTAGQRIRVWNLDTYECVYVAVTHAGSGTVRALSVLEDMVYTGGQDTTIKGFRLDPSRFDPNFETHNDDDISNWHLCTNQAFSHLSVVNSVEVCGKYVCSAGGDGMVRVWYPNTLKPVQILRGHRGSILTLKSVGSMLLSGGRDNNIRVWDMEALLCRRTLTGHKDDIMHITVLCTKALGRNKGKHYRMPSIIPEGPCLVATASADCTVRVWSALCWSTIGIYNLGPPSPDHSLNSEWNSPYSCTTPLALAMTYTHLVAGTREGALVLWSIEDLLESLEQRIEEEIGFTSSGSKELLDFSTDVAECEGDLLLLRRKHAERDMERKLKEFVRIKTVSGDPACREDCFKGAKFVAHLLEDLGAEVKLVQSLENRNPVVIGRLGNNPDLQTVTFYGHYDVQPAEEPQWKTDPFEVNPIDGYLYARGTSDNKGPILAFIYAVKDMLEECDSADGGGKALPLNISFLFEGEEENGSLGTAEAVQENLQWFENTVLTVISNTQWVGEEVPCLTYGMRGMISMKVTVTGPKRDLHSGNDGGVFNEPLVDLVRILATLVDSHNSILVPGFYDNVSETLLDASWPGLENSDEFSIEDYKSALGVPSLTSMTSKKELLKSRWCRPTLSVVDTGPARGVDTEGELQQHGDHHRFGPTRYSVIPGAAVGKISVRFVPAQNKDHLVRCISAHIQHEFAKLRSKNEVNISVVTSGDWWDTSTTCKFFKLAERAIVKAWGRHPLCVREGGTMPLASVLEKILDAPALLIPMGQASDNCHLANERIRVTNLHKGKYMIRHLLEEVVSSGGKAPPVDEVA